MTPISRRTTASTTERCSDSGSAPTACASGRSRFFEHLLGGRDPQLLGDEADRDGHQRVEPEQLVGGPKSGREQDPGERRLRAGDDLAGAQQRPDGARGAHLPPAQPGVRRRHPVDRERDERPDLGDRGFRHLSSGRDA